MKSDDIDWPTRRVLSNVKTILRCVPYDRSTDTRWVKYLKSNHVHRAKCAQLRFLHESQLRTDLSSCTDFCPKCFPELLPPKITKLPAPKPPKKNRAVSRIGEPEHVHSFPTGREIRPILPDDSNWLDIAIGIYESDA